MRNCVHGHMTTVTTGGLTDYFTASRINPLLHNCTRLSLHHSCTRSSTKRELYAFTHFTTAARCYSCSTVICDPLCPSCMRLPYTLQLNAFPQLYDFIFHPHKHYNPTALTHPTSSVIDHFPRSIAHPSTRCISQHL